MKKRFLAFMVCMAVLLASFTGCYSAKKDGPSTASSAQTAQSGLMRFQRKMYGRIPYMFRLPQPVVSGHGQSSRQKQFKPTIR